MLSKKIEILLEEHDSFHNKALDWFIASWEKKDEDKAICLLLYKKYKKRAYEVSKKITELI